MKHVLPAWLRLHEQGVVVAVKLRTNARTSRIMGAEKRCLHIQLKAPPRNAASALAQFMANALHISDAQVQVISGACGSAHKRVNVANTSGMHVLWALAPK